MTALAAGGISIDLPNGWDGQIRGFGTSSGGTVLRRADEGDEGDEALHPAGSVLHAATFALPPERGDYGSGAVEVMGGSDVLICLLEHEPEAAGTALFSRQGIPRLDASQFSPQAMQRAIPGMAGTQHFFQVNGRPLCLYVVVGSFRTRGPLVRSADSVVRTIQITG
ncbi:MAG: hypothetical protein ACSLFP_00225 [Acidimicrobiales bacterium]